MSTTFTGLVLILCGVLAMLGSALNWRIVAGSGKLLNRLLGDTIARVIYFLIGIVIFVLGIGLLIGRNWLPF
jgi:uncharacterized membrane protein YuzA (DUF378 family)